MAKRRRLPIWKKAVFGIGVTIVFFLALEGLLAVVGIRATTETHDPFVGFASNLPLFEESSEGVMTTAPNKLAYFNEQSFRRKKTPGTYRIFCLGGSTTYGRPYDDTTSFPGWLREMLPIADSSTDWEVINAAGVSYASYRLTALMEEMADYEPDLFIVYTGHNEFLEDRTYGNIRDISPAGRNIIATAARTRTFTFINNVIGSTPSPPSNRHELPAEVDAVLDHTVGPSSYHRDDEQSEKIIKHFEINLSRMAAIARNNGATIIFVTPGCNMKDFSPFKSEHAGDMDEKLFEQKFAKAKKLDDSGNFEKSLAMYQSLEKIDDRFAELHFRKARALLALDRFAEATVAFQRAVEEDVCPLRANLEIEERIRQVAANLQIPLVDFQSHLRSDCLRNYGHNSPGNEYFLDHVHPNIKTNGMIARTIVDRMIELRIVDASEPLNDAKFDKSRQKIESKIDNLDHALALRNLSKVLNWAGKHLEAGPPALEALKTLPDDPEILVLSAAYLKQTGNPKQAIEYYQKATQINPDYTEAQQMLGAALVDDGEYEAAIVRFKQVVRLNPHDSHAHHMIGILLAELSRFDEAINFYRTALELAPDSTEIQARLNEAVQRKSRAN